MTNEEVTEERLFQIQNVFMYNIFFLKVFMIYADIFYLPVTSFEHVWIKYLSYLS